MARAAKVKARGPGRLSASDTEALATQLLDAAERVFVAQGYAASTVDAIAKNAGVTRKTLYARYANKEEIFAAVIARMLDDPDAPAETPRFDGAGDVRAQLLKIALEVIAIAETPRTAGLSRLIYAEAHKTPELVKLSEDIYVRSLARTFEALRALRASGKAPGLPSDDIAAPLFMEMVVSTPRSRAILGAPLPRKHVVARTEAAVDFFLAAIGYKKA